MLFEVSPLTFYVPSVQQFVNESALSVSLDVLRLPNDQWTTMLTFGSNTKVLVLEKQ